MRASVLGIGALAAGVGTFAALTMAQPQLLRFEFTADAQGWEAIPSPAAPKLSVIADSSAVGGRSLEVRYRVERRQIAGIRRTVERADGAGVRVNLKTDVATLVVIGLIEADGSAYNKVVFTTAGEWQSATTAFSEFELAQDSKDENGSLDVARIRALVIADAAGFTSDASGEHRLWVASYEFVSTTGTGDAAGARQSALAPSAAWDFEKGPEGWIVIPAPGGAAATLSVAGVTDHAAAGAGAVQIRFRVEKNKLAGLLRPVSGVAGVGVKALLLTRAPTLLVLGLVERDGSSYNYAVQMKGDEWHEVDVLFQNFSLAQDSSDENGRLDLAQVQALVIGDAVGFLGEGSGARELLVGRYEIVSEAAAESTRAKVTTGFVPLLPTGAATESGARATAGIAYRTGKFQQGFLADGPGELVAVPTAGLGREQGTIELWISPQFDMVDVRDFTGLVTMHAEPFATGFQTSLLLVYSKSRQIVLVINANNERPLATEPLDWRRGEWHHLAVSWGPRGTRLYLDGRVAAENRRGEPPAVLAPDIVLGNHSWGLMSQRFANTVIDEFRLSSVQRSDEEIAAGARRTDAIAPDERTVALEHFDGMPAPPLTLAAAAAAPAFHARSIGSRAPWTIVAPSRFTAGSTLSHTLSTPGGRIVDRAEQPARAGDDRVDMALPPLEVPGFYRLALRLERDGRLLNQGDEWFRVERPQGTPRGSNPSLLFGASASVADSVNHEEFFRRAAGAGVRSVRLPFEWAEIEPRDDSFVWTKYDRIVGWAKQHGIELVATLFWENPVPAWAGRGKPNASSSDTYPPENLKEWDEFVYQVVARYKADIHWWIPVNEPNLPRYWYPKPDAKAYVALLRATRDAVTRGDPDAKIVGLSVSGVDLRFLEEAFKAGALNYSDAVGVHPYRGRAGPDERVPINILDPSSAPGTFLDGIRAVGQLMRKYGGDRQQLWLDEVGQPYRDDFIVAGWGVPEETAAAYLVKTYVEAKASGLVDRVLWYSLWGGDYGSFALLTPDGRPTLPFVAYAAAAEKLAASDVVADGARGRDIRSVRFSSSTESIEVVWSLRGAQEIALQPGERALDLYGFPVEVAGGSRQLPLTVLPSFIVQSKP